MQQLPESSLIDFKWNFAAVNDLHNKLTSSCKRYKDTKIHRYSDTWIYKNVDSDKQADDDDDDGEEQHHHEDDNDELHGNALEDDNNYNRHEGKGIWAGLPGTKRHIKNFRKQATSSLEPPNQHRKPKAKSKLPHRTGTRDNISKTILKLEKVREIYAILRVACSKTQKKKYKKKKQQEKQVSASWAKCRLN